MSKPSDRRAERAAVSIPFPEEIAHLSAVNRALDEAARAAQARVAEIDEDYMEAKRYMVEHRADIDPKELFQSELGLNQIDRSGAFAAGLLGRLLKLKDSPYFARIDFEAAGDAVATPYYIGRFAFSHAGQLLISDWRSPVAGMFYDYELGPAHYTAPMGLVEGTLTLKRQFKIAHGAMVYALESSMTTRDDVLTQVLSQTSDEKMKSIIATIQREQNQIIRNPGTNTLIIQGAAGSGKTSIALHRVAFLLYRYKEELSAERVAILSPNAVFGDYIASVLPELGEEPIRQVHIEDIARAQLGGVIDFESAALMACDARKTERAQYKSTLAFAQALYSFLKHIPALSFEAQDVSFGPFAVSAQAIAARFDAYARYPVKRRILLIADDLREQFLSNHIDGDEVPKRAAIAKALSKMLKVAHPLALYKAFYERIGAADMLFMPGKRKLEWADVYPFLYVYAAFEGLKEYREIRHLVVDEMQDYTPIAYAVLSVLFRCPKTLLGDFGQRIDERNLSTLSDLSRLYPRCQLVNLTKSYRSTSEIIAFAQKIKPTDIVDAALRHGDPVEYIPCADEPQMLSLMKGRLDAFARGDHATLGIIAKTQARASALYDLLSKSHPVHLLTADSDRFESGVTISSVALSKGLEFDEVIVPDVDADAYASAHDRDLLYVACTRAMHRLTLYHASAASPLI